MHKLLCHFLIGIPGSGKTTFARQLVAHDPRYTHISPDLIREQLYDDPIIQGDWSAIEHQIELRFEAAIQQAAPVVYDATNIQKCWRTSFLQSYTPPTVQWLGWVFQTPVADCIQRNENRSRSVPLDVIIDNAQLLNQYPPTLDEGFYAILDVPQSEQGAVDMGKAVELIQTYDE